MDNQIQIIFLNESVPEFYHLAEFECGVYMKKLEGEPAGIECLSGQVDQYRGVFPDGIKKYGIFKLADGIPENVNAFCLQLLKLAESANAVHFVCSFFDC